MEAKGFEMTDATEQFDEVESLKKVWVAVSEDEGYQIEFYEMEDEDFARGSFEINKARFEEQEAQSQMKFSVTTRTYAKYTLHANGKIMIVSQIGNTMMYANADDRYLEDIEKIVSEFGY